MSFDSQKNTIKTGIGIFYEGKKKLVKKKWASRISILKLNKFLDNKMVNKVKIKN